MVRGIVDECGLYDIIEGGQRRELWLEISPQSFNVRVKAGIALTQLMIFAESAAATPAPLFAPGTGPLVYDNVGTNLPLNLYKDMLILSLRVPSESSEEPEAQADGARLRGSEGLLAGYEAVTTNEVIDMSRVDAHDPSTFFRPVYAEAGAGKMTLEKDRFYILATKEKVSIPLTVSAEMVPFSHHVGGELHIARARPICSCPALLTG